MPERTRLLTPDEVRRVVAAPLPVPSMRKALREAAGYTQEAFARVFGVSVTTLQRWEWGDCEPSGVNRRNYSAVLCEICRQAESAPLPVVDL